MARAELIFGVLSTASTRQAPRSPKMVQRQTPSRTDTGEAVSPSSSGLSPQQIVQTYSPNEWEAFIEEWSDGFDPPYTQVIPLGGPGDKGRDIAAHVTDPADESGAWDNYQCKHYDHALRPTDVYGELGKLCLYCYEGAYTVPRRYRFVAPHGVGTKLYDLLRNPDRLKAELMANWEKYCQHEISDARKVPLRGRLREYVQGFDFRIVWFLTPAEIIAQHRRTSHWHRRFRLEPPTRPQPDATPKDVQAHELRYVECLLDAYTEHLGRRVTTEDLSAEPRLERHFKRSRGYFYSAEALGRFSRDYFAPSAFDVVKGHVYDGVIDVVDDNYPDGLARLKKVTELAVTVQLPASDLKPYLYPSDRKGLCHHLANDGKLQWCGDGK
jgi:C-terminal domain 6 of the ABC-three component (ABC-3C) systems